MSDQPQEGRDRRLEGIEPLEFLATEDDLLTTYMVIDFQRTQDVLLQEDTE